LVIGVLRLQGGGEKRHLGDEASRRCGV
jgi:hypothetical protein